MSDIDDDITRRLAEAGRMHRPLGYTTSGLTPGSTERAVVEECAQINLRFHRVERDRGNETPVRDEEVNDQLLARDLVDRCGFSNSQTLDVLHRSWEATRPDEQKPPAYFQTIVAEAMQGSRVPGTEDLRGIMVSRRHLNDVVREILVELARKNEPPHIFRHGSEFAELAERTEALQPGGTPITKQSIQHIRESRLRVLADEAANFVTVDRRGKPVKTVLPRDMASAALCEWRNTLPALSVLSPTPFFRADGSLVMQPGYDKETAVYLTPSPGLPLAELRADLPVDEARRILLEPLVDFPFKAESDRANVLLSMFQPATRILIGENPTPLGLFVARQSRTGKGFLLRFVCETNFGFVPIGVLGANDHENQQKVLSSLMKGTPVILLDNLDHQKDLIHSPAIAAALTAVAYTGRELHWTKTPECPNYALWLATGNNPKLSTELAERAYSMRLDSPHANPGARSDFKIPDFGAWVQKNRARTLSAVYSVCSEWIRRGRPAPSSRVATVGGYEAWRRVVPAIVENVLELPALYDHRETVGDSDGEAEEMEGLVNAILARMGGADWTISQLVSRLNADGGFGALVSLDAQAPQFSQKLGIRIQQRTGARFHLHDQEGNVVADRTLRVVEAGKDRHSKAKKYRLVVADMRGELVPAPEPWIKAKDPGV